MSTTIGQSQRSVAELMKLSSYSEMSDDEVECIISYRITEAVNAMKIAYENRELLREMDERQQMYRDACESNTKALQCMCEQKTEPIPLVINKLEFHPMEFSHE